MRDDRITYPNRKRQRRSHSQKHVAVSRHDGAGHAGHQDVQRPRQKGLVCGGIRRDAGEGGRDGGDERIFEREGARERAGEIRADGGEALGEEEAGVGYVCGEAVGWGWAVGWVGGWEFVGVWDC